MLAIKLCLYMMMFAGKGDIITKDTTIVGKAENAKYGAMVISNDGQAGYYVDGLIAWPDSVLGKTVKVTGRLKLKTFKPPKEDEEEKGGIIGTIRILVRPKWKIID